MLRGHVGLRDAKLFYGSPGKLARGSQKARAVICPDAGLEVFGEKFALDSCQILNEWIKKIS